jgi:hypothetical protein
MFPPLCDGGSATLSVTDNSRIRCGDRLRLLRTDTRRWSKLTTIAINYVEVSWAADVEATQKLRNDPPCRRFTSHCNICRVSNISCRRLRCEHDPNEPTKPGSDFRQAKP